MRTVRRSNTNYSDDEYLSVFVGVCHSQALFEQYWDKNYELLDHDYIGFEMGVDFGINTYDEDFAVMVLKETSTNQIDDLFEDAEIFDLDALKNMFPNGLDQPYNAVIILDRVNYDGKIKDVENETFGYFKFLGAFKSE